MAPEILSNWTYNGASVDLFACAIILFIMFTKERPFKIAGPCDQYYKNFCIKDGVNLFWEAHEKNKPIGFF